MPQLGTITASLQRIQLPINSDVTNVSLHCAGTFSGANCIFEGSLDGGTTWFTTDAVRSTGSNTESVTGVLSATPAYSWDVEVGGYTNLSVRSTAFVSGAQKWIANGYKGAYNGTSNVSGTITANIGTGSLAAGTAAIGDVGLQVRANATGAGTAAKVLALGSTNGVVVKATAGRVLAACLTNHAASARYFKLHNSATVTPGTTPVAYIIGLAPGQIADFAVPQGIAHTTGICYSIVGGSADNDATAVTAGDVTGHLVFA